MSTTVTKLWKVGFWPTSAHKQGAKMPDEVHVASLTLNGVSDLIIDAYPDATIISVFNVGELLLRQ